MLVVLRLFLVVLWCSPSLLLHLSFTVELLICINLQIFRYFYLSVVLPLDRLHMLSHPLIEEDQLISKHIQLDTDML